MGPRWPYWPQMAQNGQKWPFLAILGHFGPFWACFFGVLERILAQVAKRPKMAIFGHFDHFWASGPEAHPLTELEMGYWAPGGPKWPKMAQNGRFWAILAQIRGARGGPIPDPS